MYIDYLFTLRDPLARMLSAYNYERPNATDPRAHTSTGFFPRTELYDECQFQTLEDLAQKGLLNSNADRFSKLVCLYIVSCDFDLLFVL